MFDVFANMLVSTLERNPRVPRPSSVEFKVGCKELILDRNPAEPSP